MSGPPVFHLDTPLARGMSQLFQKMVDRLMLERPLKVYLAGGMAVHLYTGERVTTDVDEEYGARIPVPTDIGVEFCWKRPAGYRSAGSNEADDGRCHRE